MKANQIEAVGGSLMTVTIEGQATRLACFELGSDAATFIGLSDASLLGDDVLFIDPDGEYLLLSLKKSYFAPPNVYRFSLKGNHSSLAVRALDGVYDWYADDKGVVRAGIGHGNDGWFFAYRPSADVEFRKVARGEDKIFEEACLARCTSSAAATRAIRSPPGGTAWTPSTSIDFAREDVGDLVFACPTNDVESSISAMRAMTWSRSATPTIASASPGSIRC